MKYIKTFESKLTIDNMTYEESKELGYRLDNIKIYMIKKYKDQADYKDADYQIIIAGRYGLATFSRILKFAKKHKDNELSDMVSAHFARIEEMRFRKETDKYNL